MKKIGILSMQRIANYGSFLQAFGLKSILEELGCSVFFVDYHVGDTLIPAEGGTGLKRKIFKSFEVFFYNASFINKVKYIKYKENYATKYLPLLEISDQYIYTPKLDMLVIGSDEVFNCVQNNTNVGFSPELFGEGNNSDRLISYAASFGNTTKEKLIQYEVYGKVCNWLKKFDALSVRDDNSFEIASSMGINKVNNHIDPVLAYDFIGKCKKIPNLVPSEKYMILYGYAGRFSKDECKIVKEYARNKGYKIYCIGGIQDACDSFIDCDPFSVIAYFKNAECVVTDTFHGTILSIINKRQFSSLVRTKGYGNSEKLLDLLRRFNLSERVILDINEMPDIMQSKIDYDSVDSILNAERDKSYAYLKEQIDALEC